MAQGGGVLALLAALSVALLLGLLSSPGVATAAEKLPYDSLSITTAPSYAPVAKWDHRVITFGFSNGTNDIEGDGERQFVREAFGLWVQSSPLVFEEVAASKAEILVGWGEGNHGDAYPFDGQNGVLAHAYYPSAPSPINGDMHFDDAEIWSSSLRPNAEQPIDLVTVAAHEIGHAIGLGHSEDKTALMYPYYEGSHRYLSTDDVNGAQFLYGAKYGSETQRLIGIQANTGVLWYHSSFLGGGLNTGSAMAPGTSPSVVYVPGDGYVFAYQGTDNYLWIYRASDGKLTNTKLGMQKGTSPSMAPMPGAGSYTIGLQASDNNLWLYSSQGSSATNTKLGMEAKSSPSVVMAANGTYLAAFQAHTNQLWYYYSVGQSAVNTTGGILPATSPSAILEPNGGFVIGFQATDNNLWTYGTAGGSWSNLSLGMKPGTSPSAAVH
jgi:hypothetical protein